jgi:LmbE family N-acetylglucosaminyl deacetylase
MTRLLSVTLVLLTLSFSSFVVKDEMKNKVILAVFAHPDDEAAIGQLLVKYGRTNKIYLVILTDGRFGIKPGFPGGDTLVKLRQTETECACKIMGLQPPVFLGFTDGFDTRNGVGMYMKQSRLLKQRLTEQIKELKPDLIITFGPDGDTGHSDHRMTSNMVTEIILKEGWVETFPLYYLGWTNKDDIKFKVIGGLNTVDPKYLNVTIKYSNEDEEQALKALDCYKSQLSPQEIMEWKDVERKDSLNTFSFRQLTVPVKPKADF